MKALALAGVLVTLTACEPRFEDEQIAAPLASLCVPIMFEASDFTLCTAEPNRHLISTDLASPDSAEPYGSFANFALGAGERVPAIMMAMNGGMFDDDGQPIGYYVEDGRRLTVLNQAEGAGNFHRLPNGVFYGEADGPWRVRETGAFAREAEMRPTFATQSGPMLVIDGRLHPQIEHDGANRAVRNAVGVDASGRALFVISDAPVSLGKLARLYRDVLNVENALHLDGEISQLWDPAGERMDDAGDLGPLIVVENRAEAGS